MVVGDQKLGDLPLPRGISAERELAQAPFRLNKISKSISLTPNKTGKNS